MGFLGGATKHNATTKSGESLLTTTVRDFDGGLDIIDNDLNMRPKYAKVLDNLERGIDGALTVRAGTNFCWALAGDTSAIVNIYDFNGFAVIVQASGKVGVYAWQGGTAYSTFTLWTATTVANFTVFNSQLIITNGVNKPLILEGNANKPNYMVLMYLVDLGSGTNVNTPIGKYCISHAQYTIIAGIPSLPSTLYISARGTSGTYLGDAAPNDGIALDLGPRVSLGSSAITGLVAYRDKLLVTFDRGVLPINLGVYVGTPSVHVPTDDGFIEEFGCNSHRSLVSVGDDTFYVDNIGVNSIERIVLYNTLRPVRASQLIDPAISSLLRTVILLGRQSEVFAVYDMRNKRYILFIPSYDISAGLGSPVLLETIGFSYTNIPTLRISAWAKLRGWTWKAACRTAKQEVYFTNSNKVYQYAFDATTTALDFLGDTSYNGGNGVPITFTWEWPWGEFNKRLNIKETRYLQVETQGGTGYSASMYIDNIINSIDGTDSPAQTTSLSVNSIIGYGYAPYGSGSYGGGIGSVSSNTLQDERSFYWPATFKIAKLKFTGTISTPLKFIGVTLAYKRGSIRR